MRRIFCIVSIVIWGNMADALLRVRADVASPYYLYTIGGWQSPVGWFNAPYGVAVAPDGRVYVADALNHRIQVFSAAGTFVDTWGRMGSGQRQFRLPGDVAIAPDGSLYIIETDNARLQRLSPTGSFLGAWGDEGSQRGQFLAPRGLAVAADGSLYIADTGNHRIQHLSANGRVLEVWGAWGSDEGRLIEPYDVAIAPDGSVLVADAGNGRVQRFSATGEFLAAWSVRLPLEFTPLGPWALATAADGTVYLLMTRPHVGATRAPVELWVKRFSPTGEALEAWQAIVGVEVGEEKPARGLAVAPDGSLYLTDLANNKVRHLSGDGRSLASWGGKGAGEGVLGEPWGIAISPDGWLYVADRQQDVLQRLRPRRETPAPQEPNLLLREELTLPWAVAVAPDRSVYVTDGGLGPVGGARVQRFGLDGTLLAAWGEWGFGNGELVEPAGIAVAKGGDVYIVDRATGLGQRFTSTGAYLNTWAEAGSEKGQLDAPAGLAIAPDGSLYVSDGDNSRIQHLTADGAPLDDWGVAGAQPGAFADPAGLAVSREGHVYVADWGNHRIQGFTPTGALYALWGEKGRGETQLYAPGDVAIGPDGTLYVADSGNHRVQVYGWSPPTGWWAEYYDNDHLTGAPLMSRWEAEVAHRWGQDAPAEGLPADGFGVRWQRTVTLTAGVWAFDLLADGEARLWVDEALLVDRWGVGAVAEQQAIALHEGSHRLCLEYGDPGGEASISLAWQPRAPLPPVTPPARRAWFPLLYSALGSSRPCQLFRDLTGLEAAIFKGAGIRRRG